MATDAGFLRRIIARPDADGPRLVYADWLDERGDPRGRFIRVQIALARLGRDHPARPALAADELRLREAHAAEWAREFAGRAGRCTFRRGFVEAVTLSARQFADHAAALLAAAPIRAVRLTGVATDLDALAAAPLRRVRELDLSGNDLGDAALGRLLAPDRPLERLESLSLTANSLTDRSLAVLRRLAAPRLTRLDLSHNHFTTAADALVERTALARLDLRHNDVRDPGRLVARSWVELLLANNPLGDAGARRLLAAPGAWVSRVIRLDECGLTADVVPALLAAPAAARLEELHLTGNALEDAGAARLIAGPWPRLRTLHLAGNGLTDAFAALLERSPLFARLARLGLAGNRFSAAGVNSLWASYRRGPGLKLDLSDNAPGPGRGGG